MKQTKKKILNTTSNSSSVPNYAFDVGVVVPIYKHAGLLPETIHSVLRQVSNLRIGIVLVNDGCPFDETDRVCLQYASLHPNKIFYVKKKNGGLSSARNAGINFILSKFSDIKAVYLMDADNRIGRKTIQKSYDCLSRSNPEVGWIYPDILKFGIEEEALLGNVYSAREHLAWNYCEAGSMISRAVLDAGARFDESMLLGYEDWEFWLQCIGRGFVGAHLLDSGFSYRQRAESMLKDSQRNHEQIMSYILKKHDLLFDRKRLLEEESNSHPRYFFIVPEENRCYTSLIEGELHNSITIEELCSRVAEFQLDPNFDALPSYFVLASRPQIDRLISLGLLQGILYNEEVSLVEGGHSAVFVRNYASLHLEIKVDDVARANPDIDLECMVIAHREVVATYDPLPRGQKDAEIIKPDGSKKVALYEVGSTYGKIKKSVDPQDPYTTLNLVKLKAKELYEIGAQSTANKPDTYWHRKRISLIGNYYNQVLGIRNTFNPKIEATDKLLTVLLPVAEFGGVEKVAHNYAKEFKRRGYKVALVLVGTTKLVIQPEFNRVYDHLVIFQQPGLRDYFAPSRRKGYIGAPLSSWQEGGDVDAALGLFVRSDVVINFNVAAFHGLTSAIRKRGAKVFSSQHLVDISADGQKLGTPHQFLAYEHAYDGVISISKQLCSWFRGVGVPKPKIYHVPNAASYRPTQEEILRSDEIRKRRHLKAKGLNILFIGRFDRQKGLDRILMTKRTTDNMGLPTNWRFVGRPILEDAAGAPLNDCDPLVHPPAFTPEALNEHYIWADVLIMLSRFEGVPLTILEAGQLGCITVATNVGAISEIINNGIDGFLIDPALSDEQISMHAAKKIDDLIKDRRCLQEVATNARNSYRSNTWANNMVDFFESTKI